MQVGIAAGIVGAGHVYISDLPYCLGNAKANIDRNAAALKCAVECVELDWRRPADTDALLLRPIDLIVGADIVCTLYNALVDQTGEEKVEGGEGGCRGVTHVARLTRNESLERSVRCVSLPPSLRWMAGLEELVEPLVHTLAHLTDRPRPPSIIIAHQTRAAAVDEALFEQLRRHGFTWEEIPHVKHHPTFHHPLIRVFVITRT